MIVSTVAMTLAAMRVAQKPAKPAMSKPAAPKIMLDLLAPGAGPAAAAGDIMTIDYAGRLSNGKIFSCTMAIKGDPNQPGRPPLAITVGAGEAIPGLDQALLGKKVGAHMHVTIPPQLAYEGNGTSDGSVPPNATLNFDVKVLSILKKGAKQHVGIVEVAPGTGPAVKSQDTVTIHYTGTFLNGLKFDSSRDRNQPFSFQVGVRQVVPGFDLGVTGLKKGGKRKVTVPPELGYGPKNYGPIPGNSTLVFDIELLDVKSPGAKTGG